MGHLHADRPELYPPLSPARLHDGVMTYVVDLKGLGYSPAYAYSDEEITRLEDAVARAFDAWNRVLAPLNVKFKRLPKGWPRDMSVITFDYERLIPERWRFDSVAGAHSFPIFGFFYVPVPVIFDSTEKFADLSDEPAVFDRPLAHPYTRFTESEAMDIHSVALHEIGHVLGLAHPSDSILDDASYNFLALESVRIDPHCLRTSDFLCGENVTRRRPMLRSELDSVMKVPIEPGIHYTEIAPAERAFVAFSLRYLNPEGADEVLAEARRLFVETSPLRFANVFEEYEKDPPAREDNNTLAHAQPIEPNAIILGSIVISRDGEESAVGDVDVYAFDVTEQTVEAVWHFDVDYGGGLTGPSWADVEIQLYDASGQRLAENDDADALDPGSISRVDPFLTHQFDAPGRYYLQVQSPLPLGDLGSAGDYELRVGVGGVPEPEGRRDVIPALADPSVADCLGTGPVDTSDVPCQFFGVLAVAGLGVGLHLLRRGRAAAR